MLEPQQIEVYEVYHLPIIKAYVDRIDLVTTIKQLVPTGMDRDHGVHSMSPNGVELGAMKILQNAVLAWLFDGVVFDKHRPSNTSHRWPMLSPILTKSPVISL